MLPNEDKHIVQDLHHQQIMASLPVMGGAAEPAMIANDQRLALCPGASIQLQVLLLRYEDVPQARGPRRQSL